MVEELGKPIEYFKPAVLKPRVAKCPKRVAKFEKKKNLAWIASKKPKTWYHLEQWFLNYSGARATKIF
jgi:hypothetical protein